MSDKRAELIEKMARAMVRSVSGQGRWERFDNILRSLYLKDAATALAAIEEQNAVVPLEPTDAMCEAGYAQPPDDMGRADNRREVYRGQMRPAYVAMLNASPYKVQK